MTVGFKGFSPAARLSLGMTALMVLVLIALDATGFLPNQQSMAKEVRRQVSENLGMQVAALMKRGDLHQIGVLLDKVTSNQADLLSAGLRRADGQVLARAGEHDRHWQPVAATNEVESEWWAEIWPGNNQKNYNIRVPIYTDNKLWGDLELAFEKQSPWTKKGVVQGHPLIMLPLLFVLGFVAFYLFLRRALFYLDPANAIPERVHQAFDTLREGVIIIDQNERIVLCNSAARRLNPQAMDDILGKSINEQKWLTARLDESAEKYPWQQALREGKSCNGMLLEIPQPNGDNLHTVLNVSPIQSPSGEVRGCLVTIDDITELHMINETLLKTVYELHESRMVIEQKNKELQMLASRDSLTGCMNRRMMGEMLESMFVSARESAGVFSCIMTDIDHFKMINDRYGHAVGDDVIKSVVRCLQSELRQDDLIFRYGGEEFCIILPGMGPDQALLVAERLRFAVEKHAGSALRHIPDLRVTSSFGVCGLLPEMLTPEELISRADDALYHSKRNGRNRVTVWRAGMMMTG